MNRNENKFDPSKKYSVDFSSDKLEIFLNYIAVKTYASFFSWKVWFQNRRAKEKRLKKDAGRQRWSPYFRPMRTDRSGQNDSDDRNSIDDQTNIQLDSFGSKSVSSCAAMKSAVAWRRETAVPPKCRPCYGDALGIVRRRRRTEHQYRVWKWATTRACALLVFGVGCFARLRCWVLVTEKFKIQYL